MSRRNFTDVQIEEAIRDTSCRSIAAVIRRLGGDTGSGTAYSLVHRVVEEKQLDTSHWLGAKIGALRRGQPAKPLLPYLRVYGEDEKAPSTHDIKLRLIRDGFKERRCETCQLTEWMCRPIPIELHHKNGIKRDFRLTNLEIICPNCHAQTPNHAGKGKRGVAQQQRHSVQSRASAGAIPVAATISPE